MAIPLIQAFIRLRPDTTGFESETKRELKNLEVKIKVIPDVTGFFADLKSKLSGKTVKVGIEPELAPGFRIDLQDKVNKLRAIRVNVAPNLAAGFRRDIQQSIDALRGVTFPVKPVMDMRALAAFRAQYRLFEAVYLRDRSFLVGPTFDPNSLRLLQIIMRDTGTRGGSSFSGSFMEIVGRVFKTGLAKAILGGVAAAPALLNLLPLIGELATASAALAASLPAAITAVVAPAIALKLAFSGIGEAVKEAFTGDDPEKLAEALKKLSPHARAFVLEMAKFKPQLTSFQRDIQSNFFIPLVGGFKALMNSGLIFDLRQQLGGIATDAGKTARSMLDVVTAGVKTGAVNTILSNARGIFSQIAATLPGLVQSFLTLAIHAGSFGSALGGGVAGGLQKFNDLIAAAAKDGRLDALFADGLAILKLLGSVLADVGSILKSVFSGLTAGSEGALGPLSVLLDTLADFLKTAEAQEALKLLGQTLNALGGAIGLVLKPLLPVVAQLAGILGSVLSQAILDMAPALGAFAESLAKILTLIITTGEPILRVLVGVLSDFLVKAITEVVKHMDKMMPVLEELLAELGPELVPVVQAFGEALLELVPIIPELSRLIVGLVPVLVALVPVFVGMAEQAERAFKVLGFVIREVVVPVIRFFVTEILGMVEATRTNLGKIGAFFSEVWNGIVDFVKGAVAAVKEEWHSWQNAFFAVRDWFASVFATIRGYWDSFVAFLRETVWPPIQTVINFIVGAFNVWQTVVGVVLAVIRVGLTAFVNFFRDVVWGQYISPYVERIIDAYNRFKAGVDTVVAGIKAKLTEFVAFFRDVVWAQYISPYIDRIVAHFNNLRDKVAGVFASIKATAESWWAALRTAIFDPLANIITNTIPNAFAKGRDAIATAFDGVRDRLKTTVNWVIDNVMNPLIRGFNAVAKAVGATGLGEIPRLAVGGVVGGGGGGGPRFAADGGKVAEAPQRRAAGGPAFPYGSAPRSRPGTIHGPGGGREDRVPLWASAGEFIVNAARTKVWRPFLEMINSGRAGATGMSHARSGGHEPMYADGGVVGFLSDVWSAFSNPAAYITKLIGSAVDRIPGGPLIKGITGGMMNKLIAGLKSWISNAFAGGGGAGPGFGSWPSSPSAQRGDSGVWRSIVALIRSTGPISGSFGNAYRPGDPLWHGSGRAVDWMGFNQDALASFLAARRPLELIHRTNNRDYAYTRGVNKGSFNQTLMNQHRNHIHIAMSRGGIIGKLLNGIQRFMGGGAVLPAGSVRTYDSGGVWPNNTLGANTSGGSEYVSSADKMDRLIARVTELVKLTEQLISTTAGVGTDVGLQLTGGAAMLRRTARAR